MEEIGDYMSSSVLRIDAAAAVQDAAVLMEANHIGSLIVEEYGEDIGIVTETDITKKLIAKRLDPEKTLVTEIMTKPILTMDRFLPVEEANKFMYEKKIRHLAVTVEDKIVGILSMKDLVSFYSKSFRMQE